MFWRFQVATDDGVALQRGDGVYSSLNRQGTDSVYSSLNRQVTAQRNASGDGDGNTAVSYAVPYEDPDAGTPGVHHKPPSYF